MSHTYAEIHAYPQAVMPRGARLVELLFDFVHAAFFTPRPTGSLRAAEAAEVRRLAATLGDTYPSLASDLVAAATRHESLDD
jgi:hypothetical protein